MSQMAEALGCDPRYKRVRIPYITLRILLKGNILNALKVLIALFLALFVSWSALAASVVSDVSKPDPNMILVQIIDCCGDSKVTNIAFPSCVDDVYIVWYYYRNGDTFITRGRYNGETQTITRELLDIWKNSGEFVWPASSVCYPDCGLVNVNGFNSADEYLWYVESLKGY